MHHILSLIVTVCIVARFVLPVTQLLLLTNGVVELECVARIEWIVVEIVYSSQSSAITQRLRPVLSYSMRRITGCLWYDTYVLYRAHHKHRK